MSDFIEFVFVRIECLLKFPRRTSTTTSGFHSQSQQLDQQQQNSNGSAPTVYNSNSLPMTCSSGAIASLAHQNSINSRDQQQNSKNAPQTSQNGNVSPNISTQHPALSSDADPNNSQSSVQKILHEMMMSSSQHGNGDMNSSGFGRNGIRGNNSLSMNVMSRNQQQVHDQDMSYQLVNGVGVNGFNNFSFDWKASP